MCESACKLQLILYVVDLTIYVVIILLLRVLNFAPPTHIGRRHSYPGRFRPMKGRQLEADDTAPDSRREQDEEAEALRVSD